MLKIAILSLTAACGLGIGTLASAQTAQAASQADASASTQPDTRQHQVIKPGDRNCIRETGSLIRAKKGQCLQGAVGRSYDAQDIRNTGQQNVADALRMLDPSVH
ncbi:hypothetical protein PCA_04555 [Rhodanobacter sp. PCA2]|nr:hypothetical protein [Rhodanobacter sp. PCA2]